jgi:hypothetical protein
MACHRALVSISACQLFSKERKSRLAYESASRRRTRRGLDPRDGESEAKAEKLTSEAG